MCSKWLLGGNGIHPVLHSCMQLFHCVIKFRYGHYLPHYMYLKQGIIPVLVPFYDLGHTYLTVICESMPYIPVVFIEFSECKEFNMHILLLPLLAVSFQGHWV